MDVRPRRVHDLAPSSMHREAYPLGTVCALSALRDEESPVRNVRFREAWSSSLPHVGSKGSDAHRRADRGHSSSCRAFRMQGSMRMRKIQTEG